MSRYVLREEPLSDGMVRVTYRGGLVLDVPAGDVDEHPDVVAWREARAAEALRRCGCTSDARGTVHGEGCPRRPAPVACGCAWRRDPTWHVDGCPYADAPDGMHRPLRIERVREGRNTVARFEVVPDPVLEIVRPAAPELVCVLDTETTGLRPSGRVCELAVAVVDLTTGQVLAKAVQLVQTDVLMPPMATAVHGITDAMLVGMPKLIGLWPRVVSFVAKHCPELVVVAHNAPFDRGVLADDLERAGVLSPEWPRWRWYDSITIARRVVPGLPTYSLHDGPKGPGLKRALKLPTREAHRAMGDVLTTCDLLALLRRRADAPWSEWCGDAHVWGEGVEKASKRGKAARAAAVRASTTVGELELFAAGGVK